MSESYLQIWINYILYAYTVDDMTNYFFDYFTMIYFWSSTKLVTQRSHFIWIHLSNHITINNQYHFCYQFFEISIQINNIIIIISINIIIIPTSIIRTNQFC